MHSMIKTCRSSHAGTPTRSPWQLPAAALACAVADRLRSSLTSRPSRQESRIARGIGGKVFAKSKAQPRNFVQAVQKKRRRRRFAAPVLGNPININIYALSAGLGGTAQKFGFASLTDPPLSCIIQAVVRATAPASNHCRRWTPCRRITA